MECPTCHRYIENEILCPRCKTDLTYLQELRQKAEQLFLEGRRHLILKEFATASALFRQAYAIYEKPDYQQALFTALICNGAYREALTRYPGQLPC